MIDYFFSGREYVRVTRKDTGPGSVNAGYPAPISNWDWPDGFGANGIDAALYSGSKCYFFSGNQYVRVTRDVTGAGSVDAGYPAPISNWGWPDGFGANGIDAALWSGYKCYFFSGNQYIRVTRGDTGPGTVDAGYPAPISNWDWPDGFGANGIDAALYSGSKCYFFSGNRYIRVSRGEIGPGLVDAGYPAPISNWGWPDGFGANGIDAALYSGGPLVPPPAGGPVSNVNYFLDAGGQPLTDVTATMNFDSDFASDANGYSFQLNCYSTEGPNITTEWQQYVIRAAANSTELLALINNWSGTALTDELIYDQVVLGDLAELTIPAGYSWPTIALNVRRRRQATGAVFTVRDETGKSVGSTTLGIVGQTLQTTHKPATTANLAPHRRLSVRHRRRRGRDAGHPHRRRGDDHLLRYQYPHGRGRGAVGTPTSTTVRRKAPTSSSTRSPRPRARRCPSRSSSRLPGRLIAASYRPSAPSASAATRFRQLTAPLYSCGGLTGAGRWIGPRAGVVGRFA